MMIMKNIVQLFFYLGLNLSANSANPHAFRKWLTIIFILHNIFPLFGFILLHYTEILELTSSSATLVFSLRGFFFFADLLRNEEQLKALVANILTLARQKMRPDQKLHLDAAERKVKKLLVLNFGVMCFLFLTTGVIPAVQKCFQFFSGTVTETTFDLPYGLHFFFDTSITVIYQLLYVSCTVSSVAVDLLFVGFAELVAALHRCLSQDFHEIDDAYDVPNLLFVRQRLLSEKLKLLVFQHGQMIQIIKDIERIFGYILLVQFATSIFMLATLALKASYDPFIDLGASFFGSLLITYRLYMYCAAGNLIISSNDEFLDEVYGGHWYGYPLNAQQDIAVIGNMSRLEYFKIFKVLTCDLKTFSLIMQASFSLYSLLKYLK